jgi:hypothetical protein
MPHEYSDNAAPALMATRLVLAWDPRNLASTWRQNLASPDNAIAVARTRT